MKLTPENIKGLDNLANAVVAKAAADYKKAYMTHLKKNNLAELEDLRRFFRSQWCMVLTDLDTEMLMTRIEQKCIERFERKKKRGNKNQVSKGRATR